MNSGRILREVDLRDFVGVLERLGKVSITYCMKGHSQWFRDLVEEPRSSHETNIDGTFNPAGGGGDRPEFGGVVYAAFVGVRQPARISRGWSR